MSKRERLVIIDSHALIHRAYHAIPPLTTKNGEIVNAVYGFTVILLNVIKELKPDYVAVAFDLPGKTIRHEQYDLYKANRSGAPDDLISQIGRVRDVVNAFNIPIYEMPGYEADDVIGAITVKSPSKIDNYIVTGDMDELQLVNKRTKVYTMRKGFTDTVIYDEQAVIDRYGLTPEQFVDYKALKGDPSDNIPGVTGIGEKTASDLISTYESLDNVYKNLRQIKPAVARKLEEGKEIAYLSQKLSRIEVNLPINLNLDKCLLHDYDKAAVYTLFQDLGFKSLLSKLPGQTSSAQVSQEPKEITKPKPHKHITTSSYILVNKIDVFEKLTKKLSEQKELSFDTETDSINEIDANLVGMSFSFKEGEAYYIPVGHDNGEQLDKKMVLQTLKPILENIDIGKIGHNIKYDYVVLKNEGVNLGPIIFDTMISAYLTNPNARAQRLDELAFSELGLEMIKIESLIGKGKDQIAFDQVQIELAKTYAAEDADITWRLYQEYKKELAKKDLLDLMYKIEAPLIPILGDMENNGILINSEALHKLSGSSSKRLETLSFSIKETAGGEFNIASPAQLQKVLFEKLKLQDKIANPKDLKKLKTGGYSTAAQELEKLRGVDPIIDDIFEFRELSKLKNTYIDVLPKLVNQRTGRVHTSYNQAIAQTGRLSSSNPNLQNIPVRTKEGLKIREAFVPKSNFVLLSADYSQIELRVIAHIAQVKKMIEIFKAGRDIHGETAAAVFGVEQSKVSHSQRRIAKIINFGILYGVSAHGLKQQTGISYDEGKDLIKKYFELYPEIKAYSENMVKQAKELGYVETIFGRRRYLPEINSTNFIVRGAAERMAVNMPVQGTAADLMKLAMIDIANEIQSKSAGARMILQVHDELVFEVPQKDAEAFSMFVVNRMDNVVKLSIPIETAVHWGNNWGEAK